MDAFAKTSRGRADQFEDVLAKVRDGAVGRMAFGIMPASFVLYDRYMTFYEDCVDGLRDAAAAMDDIASAVDGTRESYVAADTHNTL